MKSKHKSPADTAAVWLWDPAAIQGAKGDLNQTEEWKSFAKSGRLLARWTEKSHPFEVDVVIEEEPSPLLKKRGKVRVKSGLLRVPSGELRIGWVPYYTEKKGRPPAPEGEVVATVPPGDYGLRVMDTSWTGNDETRFTKAGIKRFGKTRWRVMEAVDGCGCLSVVLGIVIIIGVLIAASDEGRWGFVPKALLFIVGIAGGLYLLMRLLKRIPYLRRVDEVYEEIRQSPEWQFPDLVIQLWRLGATDEVTRLVGTEPQGDDEEE